MIIHANSLWTHNDADNSFFLYFIHQTLNSPNLWIKWLYLVDPSFSISFGRHCNAYMRAKMRIFDKIDSLSSVVLDFDSGLEPNGKL